MRLSSPLLSLLINFLLGASWAFALIGAATLFFSFLSVGIIYAIFGAFLGSLPGLFMVLLIEYFLMREEKLQELRKQTKLLEELVSQNRPS
ncbi:MAG: hypothetical protein K0U38_08925 [Epsilonproteobacteria bacterium]|nr:hypothetical protein [Campylobacterota bacterium]